MGLRFDPIGGGQFKAALKAIIEAERQPIRTLEGRKAIQQARHKLFQEFKGKFSNLEKAVTDISNFRNFRELKIDLGDGAHYMSASVDKFKAEPGSYVMQIDQLAERSSVISNGHESPDEANLGVGFIVADTPDGDTKEIWVNERNASLHGIASLINAEHEIPFRATVVQDVSDPDHSWRLILAAKKDGELDTVTFPDFYFLDGYRDFYVEDIHDPMNAYLKLDGFEIDSTSNDISDFITGVNIQLKQAAEDHPFVMKITEDFQKIAQKVKAVVDQVNGILEFVNKQNQVDEKSDTKTMFTGDASLQNIEFRLRNLFHEGFPVGDPDDEENFKFVWMNQFGIEFAKTGQLTFSEDKLTQKMEKNFDEVSEAVTGPFGFAAQLKKVFSGYTRTMDGVLAMREKSMQNQIKKIDDDIAQKEIRIDARQQALTGQFARLQASLSDMQRQQQYLSATLPGAGGGGNLVQQLLGG